MSIRIGQASLGETGGRGQKPGNQTGRELNFSYWYNGSWLGILRFKDPAMSERAAQACEDGVRNRNIGYDMDGRNTAYAAAEAVDFALGKINKPVETDCSAFMMLCAISAGATELKKLFRRQGNSCTTYCMLHDWPTTGQFEMLSGKKFLTDDRWLRRGDILVYLGKESIAEKLSQTAVTEIVGVVALYCLKSLFEKRKGFGAVGKKEAEETDQEI